MKKYFLATAFFAFMLFGCSPKQTTPEAEQSEVTEQPAAAVQEYSKIIAAWIYIKPDKVKEFTELFKGITELTLTEPGCTGYQLYQDPYDPTKFIVFETYKNQAAVDAHFAAPYFKEYGDKIGPLTSQPAVIMIYDVAGQVQK